MAVSEDEAQRRALAAAERATKITLEMVTPYLLGRDCCIQNLETELKQRDEQLEEGKGQLQQKDELLRQKDELLRQNEAELGELPDMLEQAKREATVELNEELAETRATLLRSINPVLLYCRVRPLDKPGRRSLAPEKALDWAWNEFSINTKGNQPYKYSFRRVFRPTCDNGDVFREIKPTMTTALAGRHAILITYGETQSGKSWTTTLPNRDDPPILDRFADLAFAKFNLRVTWVEMRSNIFYDLLDTSNTSDERRITYSGPQKRTDSQPGRFLYSEACDYFAYTEYRDRKRCYMEPKVCESKDRLEELRALAERNRGRHEDKKSSSRGPSWLELRLHNRKDDSLVGLLTIVDLMGAESSAGATDRQRGEARGGRGTNNELGRYLEVIRNQHRRTKSAKSPESGPAPRGDNMMRILHASFEGHILASEDLPHVAVLAHIHEGVSHQKENVKTLKQVKEWEMDVGKESKAGKNEREVCNECEGREREVRMLEEQVRGLEAKLGVDLDADMEADMEADLEAD